MMKFNFKKCFRISFSWGEHDLQELTITKVSNRDLKTTHTGKRLMCKNCGHYKDIF